MNTVHRLLGAAIAIVLLAGLLAVGAQPTGAATADGVVPSGARVAARRVVGPVTVLLTAERSDLVLVVAHHESKGWFGVRVDPVPRTVTLSWTATDGSGDIPALSAVYGHAISGHVRVTWDDGVTDDVPVGTDGLWLSARPDRVPVRSVDRIAPDGTTETEPGP